MNRHWSRPRPVAGGTEQNHVAMDGVECGAEKPSLESEILVINTVENMVPLFNRLTEQAYLTNAEHAEFIRLYKFRNCPGTAAMVMRCGDARTEFRGSP